MASEMTMKPKTRAEMLKIFKDFMESEDIVVTERIEVWNCLSALRGPDSENEDVKRAVTLLIREKLVGKTLTDEYSHPAFRWDNENFADFRRNLSKEKMVSSHYLSHAIRAFELLGLKWDEVNNR